MNAKIVALVCVLAGACSHKSTVAIGDACTKLADCPAGTFCTNDKCSPRQCQLNTECGNDVCNANFVCVAGAGAPLSVTGIRGDTADATSPEGYVIGSGGIVITGTGFDTTVQAFLVDAANVATALVSVRTADAQTLTAALPALVDTAVTSASAGVAYAVRVSTSSGGTVSRTISLLRGSDGTPGNVGHQGPTALPVTLSGGTGITVTGSADAGYSVAADTSSPGILFTVTGGVAVLPANHFSAAQCPANARIVSGFCVTSPGTIGTAVGSGPGIWKNGPYDTPALTTVQTTSNPALGSAWVCDLQTEPDGVKVQAYAVCMTAPAIP